MNELIWKTEKLTQNGTKQFRLNQVSVSINAGITAVMGDSGAGKTSLLNILVGFEKADSGSVECFIDKGNHALDYFWVPQNYGLWPQLSAMQHLTIVNNSLSQDDCVKVLKDFDIDHIRHSKPLEMSQGECARLSIARAIASDAKVLVMDEPLAHVDPSGKERYWKTVIQHVVSQSKSLLFSSHTPEHVVADAAYVICLQKAEQIYAGPVESLYWQAETPDLAKILGDTNWFEPADGVFWLGYESANAFSVRPEQMMLHKVESSQFKVESSRFLGMLTELVVCHEREAKRRTFLTRLPFKYLNEGDFVTLGCYES